MIAPEENELNEANKGEKYNAEIPSVTKKKRFEGEIFKQFLPQQLQVIDVGWKPILFTILFCTTAAFVLSMYFTLASCSHALSLTKTGHCQDLYNPTIIQSAFPVDLLPLIGRTGQLDKLFDANVFFSRLVLVGDGTLQADDFNSSLLSDFTTTSGQVIGLYFPNMTILEKYRYADYRTGSSLQSYGVAVTSVNLGWFPMACTSPKCADTTLYIGFTGYSPYCNLSDVFILHCLDKGTDPNPLCNTQYVYQSTSVTYIAAYNECGDFDMIDVNFLFSVMMYYLLPKPSPFYDCISCTSLSNAIGASLGTASTAFSVFSILVTLIVSWVVRRKVGKKLDDIADLRNAIKLEEMKGELREIPKEKLYIKIY